MIFGGQSDHSTENGLGLVVVGHESVSVSKVVKREKIVRKEVEDSKEGSHRLLDPVCF